MYDYFASTSEKREMSLRVYLKKRKKKTSRSVGRYLYNMFYIRHQGCQPRLVCMQNWQYLQLQPYTP